MAKIEKFSTVPQSSSSSLSILRKLNPAPYIDVPNVAAATIVLGHQYGSGKLWGSIMESWLPDHSARWIGGTFLVTVATHWSVVLGFYFLEHHWKPAWLEQYRLQPRRRTSKQEYEQAMGRVAFQHAWLLPLIGVFLEWAARARECPDSAEQLPNGLEILIHTVLSALVLEVCFYYSHRFFHHPSIYQFIHKKHHLWVAPASISATDSHPLENIITNIGPLLAGPLLLRSHLSFTWAWLSLAIFNTTCTHSGFHLPKFPEPEKHDAHHAHRTVNYGVFGLLDWLHGTQSTAEQDAAYSEQGKEQLTIQPISQRGWNGK